MNIADMVILSILEKNKDRIKRMISDEQDNSKNVLEDVYVKDVLVNDFQQCMYMLRHYDVVNWDLTKFAFAQILVVFGACWSILNYEREETETLFDVLKDGISNYIVGIILLLSAGFIFLTLAAILRNRIYFVQMSRYLNEHRHNVLKNKPYGFENKTKMWSNPSFPDIIDYGSTQILCMYLFFICFFVVTFLALYLLTITFQHPICISLIGTFLSFIAVSLFLYFVIYK